MFHKFLIISQASIIYVDNNETKKQFERQKEKFSKEGKLDKYGNVAEVLLFHGTSWESLNKIVEDNFSVDHLPLERGKVMLFGRGVYLSELPGVSLMYGENLLLCKASLWILPTIS